MTKHHSALVQKVQNCIHSHVCTSSQRLFHHRHVKLIMCVLCIICDATTPIVTIAILSTRLFIYIFSFVLYISCIIYSCMIIG